MKVAAWIRPEDCQTTWTRLLYLLIIISAQTHLSLTKDDAKRRDNGSGDGGYIGSLPFPYLFSGGAILLALILWLVAMVFACRRHSVKTKEICETDHPYQPSKSIDPAGPFTNTEQTRMAYVGSQNQTGVYTVSDATGRTHITGPSVITQIGQQQMMGQQVMMQQPGQSGNGSQMQMPSMEQQVTSPRHSNISASNMAGMSDMSQPMQLPQAVIRSSMMQQPPPQMRQSLMQPMGGSMMQQPMGLPMKQSMMAPQQQIMGRPMRQSMVTSQQPMRQSIMSSQPQMVAQPMRQSMVSPQPQMIGQPMKQSTMSPQQTTMSPQQPVISPQPQMNQSMMSPPGYF